MSEVTTIFSSLDAPFINFDKPVEPIVWQSKDMLVMQMYELKVPTLAGATIDYSFSTTIGDINFSTEFRAPGQAPRIIVASMRVPSDIETVKGNFKSESDGSFVLLFDNSYSWFNAKMLTYNVRLFQPAFTLADNSRVRQSQRLLQTTLEDSRKAQLRFHRAVERSNSLHHDVTTLETRIAALSAELDNKRGALKTARDEVSEMNVRIRYNLDKRNGLCIRCLDKKALTTVLSYLGKEPASYLVCKYWKTCVDDENSNNKNINRGSSSSNNNIGPHHHNNSTTATAPLTYKPTATGNNFVNGDSSDETTSTSA